MPRILSFEVSDELLARVKAQHQSIKPVITLSKFLRECLLDKIEELEQNSSHVITAESIVITKKHQS